jgi:hypothetical protein
VTARRGGFTLAETLIALVLSSFVIMLVSNAFLQQNRFYSTQTIRTGVQDNVRAATDLLSREIRHTAEDGVLVAGPRTLTIRSPMAIGVVCDRASSTSSDVGSDGGEAALETSAVGGLALRNDSTWDYQNAVWSALNGADGSSASNCEANGADTVGAYDDFHRLSGLNSLFSGGLSEGDVVMLFRETTFSIRTSTLDPTTLGLFKTEYGGTAVEFATGMDTTAQFQYRTGGSTYADTISGLAIATVDAVRFIADARRPAPTGGVDDITFGWSVNVPLRNIR